MCVCGGGGGGGTNSFGVVEGRHKRYPLKGGRNRFYTALREWGAPKVSDPQFSHFVAPLPVNNGQSLRLNTLTFSGHPYRPATHSYTYRSVWGFLAHGNNFYLADLTLSKTATP